MRLQVDNDLRTVQLPTIMRSKWLQFGVDRQRCNYVVALKLVRL